MTSRTDRVGLWQPAARAAAIRRCLDIAVAAAGLVVSVVPLVLVAVAILIDGGRPIFFTQVRLGERGRHFRMYKFRKFSERAAPAGYPLTLEGDDRLSRVGRILARTKIDELPQLWNVLKGDMSIVGPRPESLAFRDCFVGPYKMVLNHRPGIFGPSQVLFRNEATLYRGRPDPEQFYRRLVFPLKAEIDLAYFAHRTVFGDIAYLVRGVSAVIGGAAVYQQTAAVLIRQVEDQMESRGSELPLRLVFINRHGHFNMLKMLGDLTIRGCSTTVRRRLITGRRPRKAANVQIGLELSASRGSDA